MFSYQILNQPEKFTLDEDKIKAIFKYISMEVNISQNGILNIAFLSDEEIQSLNHIHRKIDKTTDVLSFHYFEDFSETLVDSIAGELIFSESKILTQSEEYGHSNNQEFEILLIHSILHILGFDHEDDDDFEEMWEYEKKIRSSFSLNI